MYLALYWAFKNIPTSNKINSLSFALSDSWLLENGSRKTVRHRRDADPNG